VNAAAGRRLFPGRRGRILAAGIPAAAYLVFLLVTLPSVPFHPDEATYIYMSRDLERIFQSGPLSVCWRSGGGSDPLQVERERDCPLARYAIGLARIAGGLPATDSNWDWSADWEQNLRQGALPSDSLLLLARIPQTLLLFLAVLLMARIGWKLGGGTGALVAAAMFGLNSQVLLHARRAMGESALLFGMILTVAVVLEQKPAAGRWVRNLGVPLWTGAALAVAALAKYSGLLLAPVALAGMFVSTGESSPRRLVLRGAARCGVLLLGFLAVFLAADPVFWCHPFGTLSAVAAERQRLLAQQVITLRAAAPALFLDTPLRRLLGVFYELFFAPLAIWDVPNYAAMTAAAGRAYLASPLNTLTSWGIVGAGSAVLVFGGLVFAAARVFRGKGGWSWAIALIWAGSVLAGILIGVPILWQRYYLPLIPVCAAFAALAVSAVWERVKKKTTVFTKD
jgi:4-amino-4-deoxy-L-arabinose transferase-like glycosyltransferase